MLRTLENEHQDLWLWCVTPCVYITVWRASCQTVVAGAHTWGVQECGASASTIASAIGKRALLFGYTAGLIVARGAVLLGFGLWCCLVGSSRTVGAFTGTCRTFVGWFRVCGVAVLSGFRIIKALRAVSLCGVGEVNSNSPRVPVLTPSPEIGNHSLLPADLGCGESEARAGDTSHITSYVVIVG